MPELASSPSTGAPTVPVALEYDGGDMDCGSGLLLAITSRMRRIDEGEVLLLHTSERSVLADLPAWARLAGHDLIAVVDDAADTAPGPWPLWIERGRTVTGALDRSVAADVEYSSGAPAPVGTRLWLCSNFHCNPGLHLLLRSVLTACRASPDVGRDRGERCRAVRPAGRPGAARHRR
ncbi:MAG: hypothetical protein LH477_08875 [Nocardioides sp.]|nr:hypothetical protein [Nocardioides sp.]